MPQTEHQPVLRDAVMQAIQPGGGVYVDATFGRGGHARALLAEANADARLIALDQDPDAEHEAERMARAEPRLTFVRTSFAALGECIANRGLTGAVDGLLLDLGVSSPQFDVAARGFSFQHGGPLDMRMNPDAGVSLGDWLARASHGEIASVIKRYGEEPMARRIASALVDARDRGLLTNTAVLAEVVREAVPARIAAGMRIHPATKTFQAFRIHINDELAALESVLAASLEVLAPGGRLAVISFHSLEDRLVKRFMRHQAKPPKPPLPMAPEIEPALKLIGKPVRAGAGEVEANPRARSAIMRVAERTRAPGVDT